MHIPIMPRMVLFAEKSPYVSPLSVAAYNPQELRPTRAIRKPTAAAIPIFIFLGRHLAKSSRRLNNDIKRKTTPEINTSPKACPYVAVPSAIQPAINPGITSTGARQIGVLEYKPIARHDMAVTSAVHTKTPVVLMPGTTDIDHVI